MAADDLHAPEPAARLVAAQRLKPRARERLRQQAATGWPELSPGAANAWLLLVTTKPPAWRDPLLRWPAEPPTLGEPHAGFLYPDPLGFWAEVRRWVGQLVPAPRTPPPGGWGQPERLAVSALVGGITAAGALDRVLEVCRPQRLLFLDEPAWLASGVTLAGRPTAHHIPDPHRAGQVYEGFWGTTTTGVVVGKAPQHPAAHRLYGPDAMGPFLIAAPAGAG